MTPTVWILEKGLGGELHGYQFRDEKHAREWIGQKGLRGSGAVAVEYTARTYDCNCPHCGREHIKPMRKTGRRIEAPR